MKKFTFILLSLFLSVSVFAQKFSSKKLEWISTQQVQSAKTVTDWIYYCNDPNSSIGTNSAAEFGCFMHIPTSLLTPHDGRQIQEVQVFLPQPENITSVELRIYEEAGTGTPGTPAYTQTFAPNSDGTQWTSVILTTPYVINASQEIIVGYFVNASGGYPAGCDAGPTNSDGDLMIWNGSWTHLVSLSSSLPYNWNIKTGIGDAVNNDAALSTVNINNIIVSGNTDISGTILNGGNTQINSLDLNWQVDNGTVHTDNLTGLTLDYAETYNFTHSVQWNATQGTHNLSVWVSNMNGIGNDEITNNDTIQKTISVATQSVSRIPLYEEFTSSTCSPCATFNSSYFNETFLNNNTGNYTLIKYQMNWPGNGDPYYTAEGGVRRDFYGVGGVPSLFIDAAEGTHFNTSQLQTDLDNELTVPAFFDISATAQVNGNNINVTANISPYVDMNNLTVQIAVVERTTTGNTGNNGETEFHYVMMKMLPDALGTTSDFTAGTPQTINESYDLSSTHVEETGDLAVVVFIQDNTTKQVFQSAWADMDIAASVNFDPSDGATDVEPNQTITLTFGGPMRKIDNSDITNTDISSLISLTDASGDIAYTGTISSDKKTITIDPDNYLPENTDITVTIAGNSVENDYDNALSETSATFTTSAYPQVNVTFNPTNGTTGVDINSNITLTFDRSIRKIDNSDINNTDISSFVSLSDASGDIAYTGTINFGKTIITIDPADNFPGQTDITVTISGNSIENEYDITLPETSAVFTTKSTVGVKDMSDRISIFPNPVNNYIEISGAENSSFILTDISGKQILSQNINSENEQINIQNLNSGIYFVKIITGNNIFTKKIIKK